MRLSDFDGQYYHVVRDGSFQSLCNLTTITDIHCLSFAVTLQYIEKACKLPHITCLIVPENLKDQENLVASGKGIAVAASPKYAFHALHNMLVENSDPQYIEEFKRTVIGEGCLIHPSAKIAEKNVLIGDHVIIQENAIIREGTTIGDNVVVMPGAILGYSACLVGRDLEGNLMPLRSGGRVHIAANVQIGAYTAIAKGLFPYEITTVGEHSMVGFAADLGHNNQIGKNVIVLDKSQICGNTVLEDNVHIAPQVIVSNRLKVGEGADVAIGSVVVNHIKKGMRVAGNYAIDSVKFLLWHRKKMKMK